MDRLDRWVARIACTAFMLILTVLFGQVCLRYAFQYPLAWPDELARSLHVWVAFPGAYLAFRRGEHVTVDYFASRLPKRFQPALDVFVHTACIAFLVVLIFSATTGMWKLALARTPAMGLPMPFLFLATFVAAVLMAISSAASVLRTIRAGRGTSGK